MTKTKAVGEGAYGIFVQKAEDFGKEIESAIKNKNWNSAAVLAVHCVISACDALTAFYLKCRSASDNHLDAIQLLRRIKVKELAEKEKQIVSVIGIKNDAEYQDKLIRETDARLAATRAGRFFAWVKQLLGKL